MKNQLMIATLASGLALAGCTTDPATGQQRINKTAIGALAGAAGGAAISKATGGDHTGRDAAIGAALGGAVGLYMDRQEKQLQQQMAGTNVEVKRDQQGNIDLVMPGNITFATNSTAINPSFFNTLNKLAATMVEYNKNTVIVMGFTDNVGNASYNQDLSQRRAESVKSYLVSRGVDSNRIMTYGFGETRPIANNDTEAGRAKNRRVEIKINAPQSVN
ncbi:OmpA family protein [Psychrobacter sp. I-STPA10]|uniref:OmpA family protein n=1 Tax=Psychrobacter sp. I-STPA10 TaxID=2585769 RepID=UPI001E544534|nr:OmpA family protein [Psychrobacter sp. I-STPA10]